MFPNSGQNGIAKKVGSTWGEIQILRTDEKHELAFYMRLEASLAKSDEIREPSSDSTTTH